MTSSKHNHEDFSGGGVVKNRPWNVGDSGSIPGQGTKIPHSLEQLSQCATTTESESHSQRVSALQ